MDTAVVQGILNQLPRFGGYQGLVRALEKDSAPEKFAAIDPVPQNGVDGAQGDGFAALAT